jgi:hypothetical protein
MASYNRRPIAENVALISQYQSCGENGYQRKLFMKAESSSALA